MLYSCPFPIRSECFKLPNTKSASFDSWTNKRLNVLIRQPHTILYLEKKKRIYHNAINHVRALGFSRCHGQLQKALHTKFYSFCVDLCVKSLKIWSGTGACSFCSKRHLNSFTWPLKSMHKGQHGPTFSSLRRNKLIMDNYRFSVLQPFLLFNSVSAKSETKK